MTEKSKLINIKKSNFTLIEYPGLIKENNLKSLNKALNNLGGKNKIIKVLLDSDSNSSNSNSNNNNNNAGAASNQQSTTSSNSNSNSLLNIELNLNKSNLFNHPIQSNLIQTGNVLIKLTKRRRKQPKLNEKGEIIEEGYYNFEAVGVINKSVRFRGMADFQHTPLEMTDDPIINIAKAVRSMDVDAIQNFKFPTPHENFDQEVWIPPPTFSRHTVPQLYDFKPLTASVRAPSQRQSNTIERLINSTRWKGFPIQTITFNSKTPPPAGPDAELIKKLKVEGKAVVERLKVLLNERPVWTRTGICNQLTEAENRIIINQKQAFPMVSWSFSDGPYRDLVIKYGYDPRLDASARFYQHIVLRNASNVRSKATTSTSLPEKNSKEASHPLSHTFDGQKVYTKVGNFQLIDITDPLLYSLIHSPTAYHSTSPESTETGNEPIKCSQEAEGWYKKSQFELIRTIIRRKFNGILNGEKVLDEEFVDLLSGLDLDDEGDRVATGNGDEGEDEMEVDEDGKGEGSGGDNDEDEIEGNQDEDEEDEEEGTEEAAVAGPSTTTKSKSRSRSNSAASKSSITSTTSKSKSTKSKSTTTTATTATTSTRPKRISLPTGPKKAKYQKAKPKAITTSATGESIGGIGGSTRRGKKEKEETPEARAARLTLLVQKESGASGSGSKGKK